MEELKACEHLDALKHYCSKCQMAVCDACIKDKHKGDPTTDLATFMLSKKQEFGGELEKCYKEQVGILLRLKEAKTQLTNPPPGIKRRLVIDHFNTLAEEIKKASDQQLLSFDKSEEAVKKNQEKLAGLLKTTMLDNIDWKGVKEAEKTLREVRSQVPLNVEEMMIALNEKIMGMVKKLVKDWDPGADAGLVHLHLDVSAHGALEVELLKSLIGIASPEDSKQPNAIPSLGPVPQPMLNPLQETSRLAAVFIHLWKHNAELEESCRAFTEKHKKLQDDVRAQEAELLRVQKLIETTQEEGNKLKTIQETLRGENKRLVEENEKLKNDNAKLPEINQKIVNELQENERKLKASVDNIRARETEINNLEKERRTAKSEVQKVQEQLRRQQQELENIKEVIKKAKNDKNGAIEEQEKQREELRKIEAQFADDKKKYEAERAALAAEIVKQRAEAEREERKVQKGRDSCDVLVYELKDMQRQIESKKAYLKLYTDREAQLKEGYEKTLAEWESLQSQLKKQNGEFAETQSQYDHLRQDYEGLLNGSKSKQAAPADSERMLERSLSALTEKYEQKKKEYNNIQKRIRNSKQDTTATSSTLMFVFSGPTSRSASISGNAPMAKFFELTTPVPSHHPAGSQLVELLAQWMQEHCADTLILDNFFASAQELKDFLGIIANNEAFNSVHITSNYLEMRMLQTLDSTMKRETPLILVLKGMESGPGDEIQKFVAKNPMLKLDVVYRK